MTELLEHPVLHAEERKTIEKVAIVVSKGSLEGVYPALIMANGARMEGIEADLFFTFFGLDAIRKDRYEKIKVATVGNPGMHMATWVGAVPVARYRSRMKRTTSQWRPVSSAMPF
jgi:peroxiredoxin family protein